MGKAQKRWARQERRRIKMLLGEKCALCPATENLEFDCIIPQGDHHHKKDTSSRISFYRRQLAEGNLQVLCAKCNSRKSITDQPTLDNTPF
jgi:hypothetical protein